MRSNYINALKGLAIFLMLWGHCIQICIPYGCDFFENTVFKFIYSFHMPLFMLISGYLFYFSSEKRNLKELLLRRCTPLLQTIVFCGILTYFATTGLFALINGDISAFFGAGWLDSLSGLWFLWSVLSASIALGIVCKITNKLWLQIILLIFGVVFVALFPNAINNIFMYPYYVIGFYFAKYKNKVFHRIINLKYIAIVIFPILLLFYEKRHYIYTTGLFGRDYSILQYLEIDLFRWIVGLIGSIFVMVLMELLYKLKPRFFAFVRETICRIGEKSLQIYVLSCIVLSSYLSAIYPKVIDLFPKLDLFFANNIWVYSLCFTFVMAVLYSYGISLIIKLLERIKLSKFLFGK